MKKLFIFFALATLVGIQSCNDDTNGTDTEALKKQAIRNYGYLAYLNYDDSYTSAQALKTAIDNLVTSPSQANLDGARTAWKNARIPYGQTEGFRFYGGPIDDEDGPEGLLNAWPIDESFIDYISTNDNSGIINMKNEEGGFVYPDITPALLESLNEDGSETNISTGYHAIEFLLWGQDMNASGPGERPYTDYVVGEGGRANADRRGKYLKAAAELLVNQLGEVRDEWSENKTDSTGAYYEAFTAEANASALGKIFLGMGELCKGELAGERMAVAVVSGNQEDEHSCFSDNTIVDIKMNFKSVRNIYYTTYQRTSGIVVTGYSINDLVEVADKDKNALVKAAFDDAAAKIDLIDSPFDQAILNDKADIEAAVVALQTLSDRIADAGIAIGAQQ